MCGRYSLFTPPKTVETRFDAHFREAFEPRYNAAPGQQLPVITNEEPETIRRLEWGLVPAWATEGSDGLINARAETIDEKPSFREAYRRPRRPQASAGRDGDGADSAAGRCLVLADGFYEWVETDDGTRPYRIAFADGRPFAMAGLWTRREPDTRQAGLDAFGAGTTDGSETETGPLETFTVVTTEPHVLVGELHHRMAAILRPGAERRWLTDGDPRDLLTPHPADEMEAYRVSTAVNRPTNDDPSLVEPVGSA